MKKKSQNNLFIHSEIKVKLLGTYLKRYFNIMGNTPYINKVHYYDLFCGPGKYDDGGEGSPLIILKELNDAFELALSRGIEMSEFNCLFNDIDSNIVETLKKNITSGIGFNSNIGSVSYRNEDYKQISLEVIQKLKNLPKGEKAFIYIDPYGYKDIRFNELKQLIISKNSEVLLFLPTHFMFRFSENGTPESLLNFIDEIVPKSQWPKSLTGLDFIENLTNAFQYNLGSDFFVDSFSITRDKNQFFCLFFFTSHIYGFDRMLDAKWEIDKEDGRGWKFNAESDNLFSVIENSPNVSKFETKLREYLKEQRSNKELYAFTLHNRHIPIHTTQILKKWQDDHILIATLPNGKSVRKSAFYISWNCYKNNQEIKAFFNLK